MRRPTNPSRDHKKWPPEAPNVRRVYFLHHPRVGPQAARRPGYDHVNTYTDHFDREINDNYSSEEDYGTVSRRFVQVKYRQEKWRKLTSSKMRELEDLRTRHTRTDVRRNIFGDCQTNKDTNKDTAQKKIPPIPNRFFLGRHGPWLASASCLPLLWHQLSAVRCLSHDKLA
jgi:hypothetical protein